MLGGFTGLCEGSHLILCGFSFHFIWFPDVLHGFCLFSHGSYVHFGCFPYGFTWFSYDFNWLSCDFMWFLLDLVWFLCDFIWLSCDLI